MNEEYVYKNVYDIEIRRIDEKMDNTLARIEARMDSHMARMEKMETKIDGRLGIMEAKLNNMSWTINLAIGVLGIVVAGLGIYISTLVK